MDEEEFEPEEKGAGGINFSLDDDDTILDNEDDLFSDEEDDMLSDEDEEY